MLITELAKRVGDSAGNGLRCFVYLLTKFTTPEELFGPVSISGLKADDYRRVTTGKLADVELAFLDETFKASSAILNYLLRLMNEREFENGRQTAQVPLISLFGASNELPQETELEALFDRFLLRTTVGYVSESGFTRLQQSLAKHWAKQAPQTITHAELDALQQAAEQIPIPGAMIDTIAQLRRDLGAKRLRSRQPAQALPDLREARLVLLRPLRRRTHLDMYARERWGAQGQPPWRRDLHSR